MRHRARYDTKAHRGIYAAILEDQNGRCAICRRAPSPRQRFAMDHNHKTDQVRGLLCGPCNRAVGLLRENVTVLYAAIDYLQSEETYGVLADLNSAEEN